MSGALNFTPGTVKLWVPPRQSRGVSPVYTRDGARVSYINLRAEAGRVLLSYRFRLNGGGRTGVDEPVAIVRVPCRIGGSRAYFRCRGVVDNVSWGRRVAKPYMAGRFFLCRHCNKLTYSSRNEGTWDRAVSRVEKLRLRPGGDPSPVSALPLRPRGMWQRTYGPLLVRLLEAQGEADEAFMAELARLMPLRRTIR